MTKPLAAVLTSLLAFGWALAASAATVTLSPADIKAFGQLSATGSPATYKTSESALGAGFTTTWLFDVNGPSSASVGLDGVAYDWTAYDEFSLLIANNNENDWDFSVSVSDGSATSDSAVQTLPNDDQLVSFVVDLTGLDRASIDAVYITVSGDLPVNGDDRTAEYTVNAVPVPAAAWLFGSGLLLLSRLRRR